MTPWTAAHQAPLSVGFSRQEYWSGVPLLRVTCASVCFQGKPFNITIIQVYAPTTDAEEAEVERFNEDLQDLLEPTPKKDVIFIKGDWNAKVESQEHLE